MEETLHLNLKRKWFDMILSGEKTEEYREIGDYWITRLKNQSISNPKPFREFKTITFSNGYAKDRAQFVIECKKIRVGLGFEDWGAQLRKSYFVIELGRVVSQKSK